MCDVVVRTGMKEGRLFELWSQTPNSLAALILRQPDQVGDKIAMIDGLVSRKPVLRHAVTYNDLARHIRQIATIMTEQGIRNGDHVALCHPLDSRLISTILACWYIGAIVVLPDAADPEPSLQAARREMNIAATIGSDWRYWRKWLTGGKLRHGKVFSLGRWWRMINKPFSGDHDRGGVLPLTEGAAFQSSQIALITLSIGQNGYLGGITRTHQQILDTHASLTGILDVRPDEKTYVNLLLPALSILAEGGTVLLPEGGRSFPIEDSWFWDQITDHAATSIIVTSAFLDRLADGGGPEDYRLNNLDRIISFGAPVFPDVQDRLCLMAPWCRIDHIYTTEAAGPVASTRIDLRSAEDNMATSVGRGILVGHSLAECQIGILPDDFGVPLGGYSAAEFSAWRMPAGETGEIVISCDYELPLFWQGRGEFENAFMVDDRRWYRTGDAGFIDTAGRLWHQGRCQARIQDKLGTIYPMAVEAAARAQIGPMNIACLDLDDGPVLVVERNRQLDQDVLYDVLSATGVSRMILIDKIPMDKTRVNRVDYRRLAMLLHSRNDLTLMNAGDEPVR